MRSIKNTLVASLATLVSFGAAASVTGQVAYDPIVTHYDGTVLAVDGNGRRATIAKLGGAATGIVMSPVSNNVLYAVQDNPDALVGFGTTGGVSTIVTLPAAGVKTGLIVDIDGTFVVTSNDGALYRVDRVSRTFTTMLTGLPTPEAIALDVDTGDYLVAAGSSLVRINRRTLSRSTIASVSGSITGVAFQPGSGRFVVTTDGRTDNVRLIDRQGTVRAKATVSATLNALLVDERNGDVYAGGRGQIFVYDRTLGARKATYFALTSTQQSGLTLWRSRKVQGASSPTKGSTYTINLRFVDSPNAQYSGALFVGGLRPGIPVGGGMKINANFNDRLVFFSAAGHLEGVLTSGIAGQLNSNGSGTTYIQVPNLPASRNLYFVCNALNRQKPGNLDLGNTIVIPAL